MYRTLMFIHLATVLPCIPLGAWLLIAKKGTAVHRRLGIVYMSLMTLTALLTLFMPALVGPTWLGHFGYIHLFCLLTLWTVPTALLAIRRGNVKRHQRAMTLLYIGALLIAGGFTLFPGRYLHGLLF